MTDENSQSDEGTTGEPMTPEQYAEKVRTMEAELAKLKSKDMSFELVRNGAEKAKKELETEYADRFTKLEKQFDDQRMLTLSGERDKALKALVGDNPALRDQVLGHYNRLTDTEDSADNIYKRMKDAFTLASANEVNPVYAANSTSGSTAPTVGETTTERTDFSTTPEGEGLLKAMGFKPKPAEQQ